MLGLMLGLGLEGAPDAAIVRHTRHATRDTPPAARGRRVQWRLFPPTLAPRCAQVRSGALRPRLEVSPTTRHATPRHDTRPGRFCVSLPVVAQRCLALPGVAWRCVALPACLPSLPNGQLAGLGEGAWHGAPLNLKSQIGPSHAPESARPSRHRPRSPTRPFCIPCPDEKLPPRRCHLRPVVERSTISTWGREWVHSREKPSRRVGSTQISPRTDTRERIAACAILTMVRVTPSTLHHHHPRRRPAAAGPPTSVYTPVARRPPWPHRRGGGGFVAAVGDSPRAVCAESVALSL